MFGLWDGTIFFWPTKNNNKLTGQLVGQETEQNHMDVPVKRVQLSKSLSSNDFVVNTFKKITLIQIKFNCCPSRSLGNGSGWFLVPCKRSILGEIWRDPTYRLAKGIFEKTYEARQFYVESGRYQFRHGVLYIWTAHLLILYTQFRVIKEIIVQSEKFASDKEYFPNLLVGI